MNEPAKPAVLVTGVAGFLGSQLAERLLDEGHVVTGLDCFTPYYDARLKRRNLRALAGRSGFRLLELDLRTDDLAPALQGAEWIFHQAAQPGVRGSWGEGFADYATHNLTGTQRLLEGALQAGASRLVYASSSSVYGEIDREITAEDAPLRPISPYGVTKLAAEHLVQAYHRTHGFPVVSLRYFTVCGPRQRPDMAFHKILHALHHDEEFPLYGDGSQERDFTFVGDAVEANLQAARRGRPGGIYNIGGGHPIRLSRAVARLEEVTGLRARMVRLPRAQGDPARTAADISLAREELGYAPRVPVEEALRLEAEWYAGPDGPLTLETEPA